MTFSGLELASSKLKLASRPGLASGSGLTSSELWLALSYILSHWLLGWTILVLLLLSTLFLRVFIDGVEKIIRIVL